jgi:hypothetical protein
LLKLDRDVLENVSEPCATILTKPSNESAFHSIRAGVRLKRWDRGEKPINESRNLRARPSFELTEIDCETQHREVGVETGTAINPTLEKLHGRPLSITEPEPRAKKILTCMQD